MGARRGALSNVTTYTGEMCAGLDLASFEDRKVVVVVDRDPFCKFREIGGLRLRSREVMEKSERYRISEKSVVLGPPASGRGRGADKITEVCALFSSSPTCASGTRATRRRTARSDRTTAAAAAPCYTSHSSLATRRAEYTKYYEYEYLSPHTKCNLEEPMPMPCRPFGHTPSFQPQSIQANRTPPPSAVLGLSLRLAVPASAVLSRACGRTSRPRPACARRSRSGPARPACGRSPS